jgi:hypothetical protein
VLHRRFYDAYDFQVGKLNFFEKAQKTVCHVSNIAGKTVRNGYTSIVSKGYSIHLKKRAHIQKPVEVLYVY